MRANVRITRQARTEWGLKGERQTRQAVAVSDRSGTFQMSLVVSQTWES